MKTKTYTPIDCNMYDILLAKATLRANCNIKYYSKNGDTAQIKARIIDVYTKANEEFMLLDNGQVIRLDEIESVDEVLINKSFTESGPTLKEKTTNIEAKENKMSFFDYAVEVIGWLEIVLSPLLAGLVIAALFYFSNPTTLRLVIAIAVILISLIIGIVIATKIWKKKGTMHFMSRIMATPELDDIPAPKKQ